MGKGTNFGRRVLLVLMLVVGGVGLGGCQTIENAWDSVRDAVD